MEPNQIKIINQTEDKATWDFQYSSGYWEKLKSELEIDRFKAVIDCLQLFGIGGKILEIGCGEGLLQSKLSKELYDYYLGIDISSIAIERAKCLITGNTNYICCDMEDFRPAHKFDIIIFSESLYYAIDPVALMGTYLDYLNEDGYMITSIFNTANNVNIDFLINQKYKSLEERRIKNELGSWTIRVFKKSIRLISNDFMLL